MRSLFPLLVVLSLLLSAVSMPAQVVNAGVGGNNTINLLERLQKDVLSQEADLVILMVGTNDMLNHKKMISFEDYADNLKSVVKAIQSKGARVILMSPPPCDTVYLFQRHPRSVFDRNPNSKMDSLSHIVQHIAEQTECGYIDIFQQFKELNLPQHNKDFFFRNEMNSGVSDGVHPTSLGYHLIAERVFYYLKSHEMLEKQVKIICFGDSITFGAGAKGAGTATGETYPAYLNHFIAEFQNKKRKDDAV
jgi:lysophospholipase L1-like esterase